MNVPPSFSNLNTNIFDEKEINNIIHNRLPQYPVIHL